MPPPDPKDPMADRRGSAGPAARPPVTLSRAATAKERTVSGADAHTDLEVVEHEDGWAVARGDEILSTHASRAGADADLFRLAGQDVTDAEEADGVLTDEQGAHPDTEGG